VATQSFEQHTFAGMNGQEVMHVITFHFQGSFLLHSPLTVFTVTHTYHHLYMRVDFEGQVAATLAFIPTFIT